MNISKILQTTVGFSIGYAVNVYSYKKFLSAEVDRVKLLKEIFTAHLDIASLEMKRKNDWNQSYEIPKMCVYRDEHELFFSEEINSLELSCRHIEKLLKAEKDFKKADKQFKGSLFNKLLNNNFNVSDPEYLEIFTSALGSKDPVLKELLLAEPCGWNLTSELAYTYFMSKDKKRPLEMLERSAELLNNIETIFLKHLKHETQKKREQSSASHEEINEVEKLAFQNFAEAMAGLKPSVDELKQLDGRLRKGLENERGYCEEKKELVEAIDKMSSDNFLNMAGLALYSLDLALMKTERKKIFSGNDTDTDKEFREAEIEKTRRLDADHLTLLSVTYAYTAFQSNLLTRKSIMNLTPSSTLRS